MRRDGEWEAWIEFFLDGVATVSNEAIASARDLFALVADDRQRLLDSAGSSVVAVRLFETLLRHPIVSIAAVMRQLGTSKPTAGRAVNTLVDAGVLRETSGKRRDRSWVYHAYLERLRVDTDSP